MPAEDQEFAIREITHTLSGLWAITNAFWVNHPDAIRLAESKIRQLHAAQDLGFSIPPTLITNEPKAALAFYARYKGNIVCKVMTQGLLGQSELKGNYTSLVEKRHLTKILDVKHAPVLLQRRIGKKLDIRVTVIGNRLFATEIHSQEEPESRTDWRRGKVHELRHAAHNLPVAEQQLCRALVKRFGLNYGAIDFVLSDAGYVFLEINPSGQFAWIETITKQPLLETLADLLINKT